MPTAIGTERLFVAAALLVAACGGGAASQGSAPATGSAPVISDVQRYMPLEANTVYAFQTEIENSGEHGVLMMHVDRPGPGAATLTVGGKAQRLSIVPEGIRLETGGWLLKAPLREGGTFKGQFGTVTVRSTDKSVEVPAGKYTGCVETVEESVAVQKRVTTVFCPNIGIVLLDAEGSIGDDFGRERALLRSYGQRVDINALPPAK
jgi:hypothetical protein